MNTVCVSSYLYLLQFLSPVSYNFPSPGFLHPWLCLFLSILFFFVAVVNGTFFLISLSVSSLLAYKNATYFWILIFYPATLLNSFISSSSFLGLFGVMLSANKESFTSSFPIKMPFISFCLIAVARTPSTT